MKALAVDYGDSRTGLAVSDITRTLAGDAWVLHSKKMQETARLIADEVKNREVSCIVIGFPKNMDGSAGGRAEKSRQLAELLQPACEAEIVLWDERLTTKDANRILTEAGKRGEKRKQKVDAVAATLILESYLASLRT